MHQPMTAILIDGRKSSRGQLFQICAHCLGQL